MRVELSNEWLIVVLSSLYHLCLKKQRELFVIKIVSNVWINSLSSLAIGLKKEECALKRHYSSMRSVPHYLLSFQCI